MSGGTQEFWVVDPEKLTVHVTTLSGATTYAAGEAIPLDFLGGGSLTVDEIFAVSHPPQS
jgi:Uma2 family endonuclease